MPQSRIILLRARWLADGLGSEARKDQEAPDTVIKLELDGSAAQIAPITLTPGH